MRVWNRPFGRRKLWRKLFAFVVLLSLLPLLVLSITMRSTAEKSIMAVAMQTADSAMDIIAYNIQQQFQKYYHLANFLTRDGQLRVLNLQSAAEFNMDDTKTANYRTLLRGYQDSVADVQRIAIAFESGLLISSNTRYATTINNLREQDWYQQCRANKGSAQLILFPSNSGPFPSLQAPVDTIMACQAILDADGECIGASMVIMYSYILAQSSTNVLDRNGSYVYIKDKHDNLLYSPIVGETPEVDDERQYLKVERQIPSFGWSIVGMMHITDAMDSVRSMNYWVNMSCLLVILIVAVSAVILSNGILRPISSLSLLMKRAQQGDLNVRFESENQDEISQLGVSFNAMLVKIQELLNQVYREQKAKRKAEMAALQANIKPHFLYNTLDTICWMASEYKADNIVQTVESLSTLFRITLSKGSEIIPVEQEIQHVTSYLQIQKVRYEDRLEYSVEVTENCLYYYVQKLILQPLVENALYHGIKESNHNGMIRVRVFEQDDILILEVTDDGLGITPEKLVALQAALRGESTEASSGYGIVNVQERLVLNYGRQYGLTIESTLEKGTTCTITHPLIRR